jgi:mono/diheme cytochrome c family protein
VRALVLIVLALLAGGCEKIARNMYTGAKERPLQSRLAVPPGEGNVATGPTSSRHVAPGAVERVSGVLAGTSSGRAGVDAAKRRLEAEDAQSIPYPVTMQLLKRGQERFDIYCEPCHSPVGDGDGMIPRRGFPHPPSYHIARLRQAPDRHFYDVMTNGYGIMYSYADRVTPEDRWSIVAYIRALQRSQGAGLVAQAKGAR